MARKELGMIHTLNYTINPSDNDQKALLDLSGLLSAQLQHQVRQGNYFKLTGLDITLSDFDASVVGGGQISGRIEYWSPTRGRCKAYRTAFASMREAFKRQGLLMRDNKQYDFRCNWDDDRNYLITQTEGMSDYTFLMNAASLDGVEQLVLIDGAAEGYEVFTTHNRSISPIQTGVFNYATGLTTGVNDGNDFVFNEADNGYTGNPEFADKNCESIPFQLSYTPGSTDVSVQWDWRPDPQLFLACAFGQLRVVIDEYDDDSGAGALTMHIAVHIAGWKSIMGDPDAKKNKNRRSKSKGSRKDNTKMTETTVTTVKKL